MLSTMPTLNEKLQAILDNTQDNIVLMDSSYRVLCFNKTIKNTLLRYFGKEVQEGDDYRDFVVEHLKEAFMHSFQKALEGQTITIEAATKLDTPGVWLQHTMNPVYDQVGDLIGISLTTIDITSRKQAEMALQDLAGTFEAIVQNTTESIVLIDKNYQILRFNKIAKERISANIKKELAIGADFRDFLYHPEEELFYRLTNAAFHGEASEAEFSITNISNDPVWVQTRVYPVYDVEGNLVAISLFAQNISARKKAEIALKESEEKARKIVESAANPILITSEDMKIKMLNPEGEAVFGYTWEELKEQHIETLLTDYYTEAKYCDFEALNMGQPIRLGMNRHVSARKKNGEEILIEASLNTFQVGTEKFFLFILQDVTHRIRTEEGLKKKNTELSLLNRVNDAILSLKTEHALISELCKAIVLTGDYTLAWVCVKPDHTTRKQAILPMAAYGDTEYLDSLTISLDDSFLSKGPTATCLRFGKTVAINDVSKSEEFQPWLEKAQKHGIASSIALPLQFGANQKGSLSLYSKRLGAFDEVEIAVLERLATNVSLAIHHMRVAKEKEKARYDLNERIKELRTIYHVSSILQKETLSNEDLLQSIVDLLPTGWQFPEICSARIVFEGHEFTSEHYAVSNIKQTAHFKTVNGKKGWIEVVYEEEKMSTPEHAFLKEERELINTLAEMLSVYYNKKTLLSELKKSEAQLASVFENTKVGLLLLDRDFAILTFNQTAYNYYMAATGMKLKKNSDFNSLMVDEKKQWLKTVSQKVLETQKPMLYDSSYERNGNTYHFSVSVFPVIENGEVIGYCHSIVDITERKTQEKERQNMIVELSQQNKDLEQFAYIVSHNLRGPLSSILGLSKLFGYDLAKEDRQQTFEGIIASSEKLDEVLKDVNMILQARRIVNKKRSTIHFEELLEKVKHFIDPLLSEKKILINHDFEEVKSMVTVGAYLEDIFYQLISNSIFHSRPHVTPRIDIWSEKKEGKIVLHFNDNGKGIDLDRYGHQVFGLYKRFNPDFKGKGLGLFMVKTQTEALNGTVSMKSVEGKGTHIILTFSEN